MRRALLAVLALVLALAVAVHAGCASTGETGAIEPAAVRTVRVTTTTGLITDTVERIGGPRVEVTGLMGPGVDPHLSEASAQDADALRGADVVFFGGLGLEGEVGDLLAELRERRPAVAVTRDIPSDRLLSEPAGDQPDPHVWLDPGLWLIAAQTIAGELARLDPAHAAGYRQRLGVFRRAVEHVAEESRIALAQVPQSSRVLVTSHDAFRYFGRAFDVDVVAVQGGSTAAEATAADVERVAGAIARRRVKAVFPETSVPPRAIRAVVAAARARGRQVRIGEALFGDAAGEPRTPEGSYTGMLQHDVRTLVEGLR